LRFAFADPPYLGWGSYYKAHHPKALDWDKPETHRALVEQLTADFPDGWAMCLSSPSLRTILPMCPEDCRVSAWVKPWASFKPGINPAYAWEPVIFRGGRKRSREVDTVRDWISQNITMKKGLTGAKPEAFCRWVLDFLGYERDDEVVDLFPGTGIMQRVIDGLASRGYETLPMFAVENS
jgi:hypothetical protein